MQSLKKLKSISHLSEKKEEYDKLVLVAKTKSNTINDLISKALVELYIIYDEFVSLNNILSEYITK